MAKMPKVLFFIEGMAPTNEEREAALSIGLVAFRNAGLIGGTDKPEACDAVAALDEDLIPVAYLEDKPDQRFTAKPIVGSLDDVIALYRELQEKEASDAAAEASPVAVTGGKESKGKKASGKASAVAAPGWTPNA